MTEKEKMLSGRAYFPGDPELAELFLKCRRRLKHYNALGVWDKEGMDEGIRAILGSAGRDVFINQPFYCDYGFNLHVGDSFYANVGLTVLDTAPVHIGNHVMLGPKVSIYTPVHPLDPLLRRTGVEKGRSVRIGNDVWIGGGAIINPGVSIGHNAVVGSGAVVTRDVPDNAIVAGNPARILRFVGERAQEW